MTTSLPGASRSREQNELGATVDAVAPWAAGSYLNFTKRTGPTPFDADTAARLAAVKATFDPDGMFTSRIGVPHVGRMDPVGDVDPANRVPE